MLLLHFNEKLQKSRRGCPAGMQIKISDKLQLGQKFFQKPESIV